MNLEDWKKDEFTKRVGSIWKAPNGIWKTFANNKSDDDLHPAILKRVNKDNFTVQIIPGTSLKSSDKCIFKTYLGNYDRPSFFLIFLAMPYTRDELEKLGLGWNGMNELESQEKKKLKKRIRICENRYKRNHF